MSKLSATAAGPSISRAEIVIRFSPCRTAWSISRSAVELYGSTLTTARPLISTRAWQKSAARRSFADCGGPASSTRLSRRHRLLSLGDDPASPPVLRHQIQCGGLWFGFTNVWPKPFVESATTNATFAINESEMNRGIERQSKRAAHGIIGCDHSTIALTQLLT